MASEEAIKEVVEELQKFSIQLPVKAYSHIELQREIALRINHLITNDFSLFISILYRLDISENKLRRLLSEAKNEAAGEIIAELIIERQLQKIATRNAFRKNSPDIPDNEKW
jgi:hypothetical protein